MLAHWDAWFKDETVPVIHAESLTEEEKREFIIKDNSSFGAWDWDVLANEWESEQLEDWGVDVWKLEQNKNLSLDEFFEDKEPADKEDPITLQVVIPVELKESVEQIKGDVTDALAQYNGIKVK